ncbi:MAG: Fic family protein [Methylotenera sp.]
MELRVLTLLTKESLSKSAISSALGQKEVSGHLNKVIRVLLNDQTLEYTLPDKPNSRLQQYRITEKGRMLLQTLLKNIQA